MSQRNETHMHEHNHDGSCCNHTSRVEKQEVNENHHHDHDHSHCSCESQAEEDDVGDIQAKYKYKIVGLDCANCAMKVEDTLNKQNFIKDAKINFSSGLLYVNPSKQANDDTLQEKIAKIVDDVEPGVKIVDTESDVDTSNKGELIHLLVGIGLFLIALYFESKINFSPIFLYMIPYLFIGYKVLWKSVRNIMKGEIFDENFLMSIATIGAFVVGSYEEAVEVMLFYSIGELLQSYAVNKSRRSISDLMDIKSEYANLIKSDGSEVKVDPKSLKINDMISIKAGEKVPVDGVIVNGASSLDISALSGEAALKDVGVDDEILAGSINTNGLLKVKVTKIFEDSTVAKILELVENAANKKSPIENFITKFAKIYTPIVVFLALAIVLIPSLIYGFDEFNTWLYRGCTFLVISCPCALVVSVPLGVFAGIGSASKIGALVKGGNYLELLNDVNCIIFDKTGTITKGNFEVSDWSGDSNILEYAAYAESYSNHPIAKSIVSKYGKKIDFKRLENYQELAGFGVGVEFDGKALIAGNEKLMKQEKIEYTETDALGTVIYIAYDGLFVGYIIISDEIKKSSREALNELRELGITNTVMLTGDREAIANNIAKDVGIQNVHAQLLPQDKVSILENYLSNKDNTVAFVGDGINDAPSLMRADIGISMGGIGSDVAIEASDLVLMTDDLLLIPKTIKISRKTKKIVMQNIVFSLAVKLIVLILSAIGVANMRMGVFADVGVTLIAIINSMRALIAYKHV
ncbi:MULTISPECIES: heavy metal translocating P-type ATPase [unclassified Breznakia]|uniref:heavy metal translocating P-type ATPase n=1 Tax=unclassified Breznakia TaxID=2623764 RepID=UPI002406C887|nr:MULTISPECIES: heavy metal translocating P-type ATPase [unclassified Breznakia]MDF9838257.1 Cd2+/Zn2+-exporting ATPase [Breznakia sp. PFB2-8]MDF9860273.1 Cd2+/Zn2+-exporting ATPase [Breznakia sp. PH5-24]